jgi:Rrf2 family nitric oxide-sensitive transcriptional repressor
MKLNTTSQYAIRIMEFIAKDTTALYNAKTISDELTIPYKYLTKIMTLLISADLIKSIRGREGGYSMIKEASTIKIIDILEAVKESINAKNCLLGIGLCNSSKKCSLHDAWEKPKQEITNMFRGTTLDELF